MIPLKNKSNVIAPNTSFPFGSIKDRSGNVSGTPVNRNVYSDMHELVEKIMYESDVIPNNQPDGGDKDGDGYQIFEALKILYSKIELAYVGLFGLIKEVQVNSILNPSKGLFVYKKCIYVVHNSGTSITIYNSNLVAKKTINIGNVGTVRKIFIKNDFIYVAIVKNFGQCELLAFDINTGAQDQEKLISLAITITNVLDFFIKDNTAYVLSPIATSLVLSSYNLMTKQIMASRSSLSLQNIDQASVFVTNSGIYLTSITSSHTSPSGEEIPAIVKTLVFNPLHFATEAFVIINLETYVKGVLETFIYGNTLYLFVNDEIKLFDISGVDSISEVKNRAIDSQNKPHVAAFIKDNKMYKYNKIDSAIMLEIYELQANYDYT